MMVFESPDYDNHEQVVFVKKPEYGLTAIIAIHSTKLGPSIGGCRMWNYENEQAALRDVLRLSRNMTYKTAALGLDFGGGKCVVIGDPYKDKTPELFQALGREVDALGGRYIVAEDVGTNPMDMKQIRKSTKFVTSLRSEEGGNGDPAPLTALGTLSAIYAGVRQKTGLSDLKGMKVAVQGLGNVGFRLCGMLNEAGADLIVTDTQPDLVRKAVKAFGAVGVEPDQIYDADVDIFAPCALGGVLNDRTIPAIKATVIAGGANNQLEDEAIHGAQLHERGIVYVPDFIACGGGVTAGSAEWFGTDVGAIEDRVREIFKISQNLLHFAEQHGITPGEAANILAEKRLENRAGA